MKIDNSIKKMEEALEKKKQLRATKDKERLVTLEGRIKTKSEKITKLQDDLANMNTEKEAVEARIKEAGEAKEVEYKPGMALAGAQKDVNKKASPVKKK